MMQSDDAEICLQREKAIGRLEDYRAKIASVEGEIVSDVASQLRGWEDFVKNIFRST